MNDATNKKPAVSESQFLKQIQGHIQKGDPESLARADQAIKKRLQQK